MDQEEGLSVVDNIVTQYNTYEDFLDSQITTFDLYYLEVSAPPAVPPAPIRGAPPGGEGRARRVPAAEGNRRVLAAPGCPSFSRTRARAARALGSLPRRPGLLPAPPSLRRAPAVEGPPRPPVTQVRQGVSLSAYLC